MAKTATLTFNNPKYDLITRFYHWLYGFPSYPDDVRIFETNEHTFKGKSNDGQVEVMDVITFEDQRCLDEIAEDFSRRYSDKGYLSANKISPLVSINPQLRRNECLIQIPRSERHHIRERFQKYFSRTESKPALAHSSCPE